MSYLLFFVEIILFVVIVKLRYFPLNRMNWIRDRVIKFLGLAGQGHLFDELINVINSALEVISRIRPN